MAQRGISDEWAGGGGLDALGVDVCACLLSPPSRLCLLTAGNHPCRSLRFGRDDKGGWDDKEWWSARPGVVVGIDKGGRGDDKGIGRAVYGVSGLGVAMELHRQT